jgi:hypothetical protein
MPADDPTCVDRWFGPYAAVEADLRHLLDSGAFRESSVAGEVSVQDLLDKAMARIRRDSAGAMEKVAAAHVSFAPHLIQTLHDYFEAYVARMVELVPSWALHWGLHPHPVDSRWLDEESEARLLLLNADVLKALAAWPDRGAMTAHDRIDLEMFQGVVELWVAWMAIPNEPADIGYVSVWFDELELLSVVACCPEADRAASAAGRLRCIADLGERAVRETKHPSRAAVRRLLARMPDWRAFLDGYADEWHVLDAGRASELRREAGRARGALDAIESLLQGEVLARADGPLGVGPAYFDMGIKREFGIGVGTAPLFRQALEEFASAWRQSRETCRTMPAFRPSRAGVKLEPLSAQVARFSRHVSTWVSPGPRCDPGVIVITRPRVWARDPMGACYVGPFPLGADAPPVIMEGGKGRRDDLFHLFATCHSAAHEAYPGHHLQSILYRESACRLRRACQSTLAVEGWATYAESVMHDTVGCPPYPGHEYVLASERLGRAWDAILDILVQTGAAPLEKILAWMRAFQRRTDLTEADLGEIAVSPGHGMAYLFGCREVTRLRDEIRRLQGAAFDLRNFHDRLLWCGPVPPRLLVEELAAP